MSITKGQKLSTFGYLRKLPSGRLQASYIGLDGNRHSRPEGTFGARNKTDANGWLAAERRMIELGTWTPPAQRKAAAEVEEAAPITLRQYADEWVKTAGKSPGTRRGYADKLRLYIYPTLADVPLIEIDRDRVKAWLASLGTDHPTANRHAYGVLSACLNASIEAKIRPTEPAFAVKGALRIKARKHNDLLSRAEMETVAASMTEPGEGFAVLLIAWCGFRPGELFELRRSDVSRNRKKITASRSVSRDRDTKTDHVGPTKTEDVRTVELPPHLVPMLIDHMATIKGREALLFPDPKTGGHMRQRQFGDRFKAALAAAGIVGQRVYDLKAYAGTMTLLAGGTLLDAMHRLGHKTPNAALHYQRATRGSEVAKRLSELA